MYCEHQCNLWSQHRVNLADIQVGKHKILALVQWSIRYMNLILLFIWNQLKHLNAYQNILENKFHFVSHQNSHRIAIDHTILFHQHGKYQLCSDFPKQFQPSNNSYPLVTSLILISARLVFILIYCVLSSPLFYHLSSLRNSQVQNMYSVFFP